MKPEAEIYFQMIHEKYKSKGILKGGELLLTHKDAVHFVEDCKNLGLAIIGIDFYVQKGSDAVKLVAQRIILR